jgi:hypothetical protein
MSSSPRNTHKREYNIQTDLIVRESTGFPKGTMTHLQKSALKATSNHN